MTDDHAAATLAQAIDWHLRQATMTAADWHAFTAWLEADPAHARAYDAVALRDALVVPVAPHAANDDAVPDAANDNAPRPRRWGWIAGLGSAAAIAIAMLLTPALRPGGPAYYGIAARPGTMRAVALADGTRIELSGGTRVTLDRHDPRYAALDQGQAVFHVRHDAAHPFTVHAGQWQVQDLGTVFELARLPHRLDVGVAEGAVIFQPGGEAITLKPGHRLSVDDAARTGVVTRIPVETVGEWRRGRLSFTDEPLDTAVAALGRMVGADVSLVEGQEARRFTGMIRLTGSPARDVPHFAAMTGTSWARHGEQWVLSPARPPQR